ncbi:hypothetical protein OQA88_13271 [Cercophora sp. LCS_1]
MLWFEECKNGVDGEEEGLYESGKKKDYRKAWEVVCHRCKECWPHLADLFKPKVIASKYETERVRYRGLINLVANTGATFKHEIITLFSEELDDDDAMMRCIGKLELEPIGAAMWLGLDIRMKRQFVRRWSIIPVVDDVLFQRLADGV